MSIVSRWFDKIVTKVKVIRSPEKPHPTLLVEALLNLDVIQTAIDYQLVEDIEKKLADRLVEEIWKRRGTDLMAAVKKSKVVDIAVVKLATQIVKELQTHK